MVRGELLNLCDCNFVKIFRENKLSKLDVLREEPFIIF